MFGILILLLLQLLRKPQKLMPAHAEVDSLDMPVEFE
jgi:hypothetical protein